ncbi:MAG: hypothetical protein QOD12_465 [Verrucomicrobiota bacterium]
MSAVLEKALDLGFRTGKFTLPNDYFTAKCGRSSRGQTLEWLEWRTGHANQKDRRNAIISSHSCNRTEPTGGDKLKCSWDGRTLMGSADCQPAVVDSLPTYYEC